MGARFRILSVALVLGFGTTLCSSQATEGKQQEFSKHVQNAQDYLRESRPDLAIPELQAASAIHPEIVELQGNLGVLMYFQGKFADSIPHLRAALEEQPSLTKIQGLLGIAEERTSDIANARKHLKASFPLIQDKEFKTEVGLELVGLCTQGNDLDDAAGVIAQLRKADPENPQVLYAAYRIYSDLSGESMLTLSLVAPDSGQMHQVLAHEETKQGNMNGAIAQFRKAIVINPHLPGIHSELAEVLNSSQDLNIKSRAEQEYRAAIVANGLDEKTECRLGEIEAQKGDTAQAYEEYSKAVELQPADADARLGLAKTLIEMDQTDKGADTAGTDGTTGSYECGCTLPFEHTVQDKRARRGCEARGGTV